MPLFNKNLKPFGAPSLKDVLKSVTSLLHLSYNSSKMVDVISQNYDNNNYDNLGFWNFYHMSNRMLECWLHWTSDQYIPFQWVLT